MDKNVEGKKGGGKGKEELYFTERHITTEYCISQEKGDNLYSGNFIKKTIFRGEIKAEEVNCSILKVPDHITALYQRDIAELLDEAVQIYFVNEQYVFLEEIDLSFKEWYLRLTKQFEGGDWWKSIEGLLKNLLRGFIKSLVKLYPDYCHGNWKNGIAIMKNGEGKIFNMKYPRSGDYLQDLEMLTNILEGIISRRSLHEMDEFKPPELKHLEDWVKHYTEAGASEEFAHLMSYMRLIVNGKLTILAPLYPSLFWGSEERYFFMEEIYDLFWGGKAFWSNLRIDIDRCFPSDWFWWERMPPSGGFREVYDFKEQEDVGGAGVDKINHYRASPMQSIRFWRNACHHYNDNHLDGLCTLTAREIGHELEETFGICDIVFRAVSTFIITFEDDVRTGNSTLDLVFWQKLTTLVGSLFKD